MSYGRTVTARFFQAIANRELQVEHEVLRAGFVIAASITLIVVGAWFVMLP